MGHLGVPGDQQQDCGQNYVVCNRDFSVISLLAEQKVTEVALGNLWKFYGKTG